MTLPPLYYGTIDATALWICLLHDAWRWGLPEEDVRSLLPALEAALGWLRDHADPDGDGFLEYLDESGTGLANQGWKDSVDSIRFADGSIAPGPVALCEVQAYAYEAAMGAADLLDHFGRKGALQWREWAAAMQLRFREHFWVGEGRRRFPALALDGRKRRVDSLTSNIGHLLGTGILSDEESRLIAGLLTGEELSSGFGLRTMSRAEGGYSPLSYHCGSVWSHDTAIAIHGLIRSGLSDAAFGLVEGLLAASAGFGYRLPELYGGDARSGADRPLPYPAACRPQAWAAAAIGPIVQALTGLKVRNGELVAERPASAPAGALTVSPVRFGGRAYVLTADRDGVRLKATDPR
jgi:glycogen debranching enzyme